MRDVRHQTSEIRNFLLKYFFLTSVICGLWSEYAFACPTCNDLVGRGVDAFKTMKFGEGIAWSMVPLFGVPVLLVGTLVLIIIRSTRKNKASHDIV